MSNFNYMDNVPVKISEKYKPPPRLYQLPQSVANKLNYPNGHFDNCPQYSYDFKLEHTVLAKIPEYKRKRQIEREARQERREKREQERQRQLEEEHKQMLGAVNYPNAAELSSSESDEEDDSEKSKQEVIAKPLEVNKDANWLASYSFNNILQPTVLTHNGDISENNVDNALRLSYNYNSAMPSINTTGSSGNSNKLANTFNYKDFEDDTSSPFDNIELKTINDLDILRQVLHNTQLKTNKDTAELKGSNGGVDSCDNDVVSTPDTKENIEESRAPQIVSDMSTFENTKAALEKVDFSDINLGLEQHIEQKEQQQQHQQNDNIPTHNYKNIAYYYGGAGYNVPTTTTTLLPSSTCYTIPHYLNGVQDQHNYQIYHNQNYLFSPNCNSNYSNAATLHTEQMHYIANNANNLLPTVEQTKNASGLQEKEILEGEQNYSKSKSVPDLFQELRDEVRNSEMRRRRSRNYSHNLDGSNELKNEKDSDKNSVVCSPTKNPDDPPKTFNNLTSPTQALVRNISSMGFPLERVTNVAQIYGDDDKKIVEHLIPLTELLDLGFDEKQISEALVKYDNNKEKALEHLIS